jgi:hypothetical protein
MVIKCQQFGTLSVPSSYASRYFIPTRIWRWNGQRVPKRWHLNYRRRWITQKKAYNNKWSVNTTTFYLNHTTFFSSLLPSSGVYGLKILRHMPLVLYHVGSHSTNWAIVSSVDIHRNQNDQTAAFLANTEPQRAVRSTTSDLAVSLYARPVWRTILATSCPRLCGPFRIPNPFVVSFVTCYTRHLRRA